MLSSKFPALITRRQLLKLGLLTIPWFAFIRSYMPSTSKQLSFYIAGVRFQTNKPTCYLDQKLNILQEHFNHQRCYSIYSHKGERIGYVPKGLISKLAKHKISNVKIDKFSPHAVPWKRYRVLLTMENGVS